MKSKKPAANHPWKTAAIAGKEERDARKREEVEYRERKDRVIPFDQRMGVRA